VDSGDTAFLLAAPKALGFGTPLPRANRLRQAGVGLSLCVALSVLYQVYLYGLNFNTDTLTGGGVERTALKVGSVALFLLCVRPMFSAGALNLNLVLKIPLLFVCATIAVVAPFLEGTYIEAINIFFFLPLLLLDWNRPGADALYVLVWKSVVWIVLGQLLLEPIIRLHFGAIWNNGAVVGGMGNPNVFGAFLIVSGLACSILLPSGYRWLAVVFFCATVLTGSLVSFVVGFGCLFVLLLRGLQRAPLKTSLYIGAVLLPLSVLAVGSQIITDFGPIQHAFSKFMALGNFDVNQADSGPSSLSARRTFLEEGLALMAQSPWSVFVGHPGGMAMYNGDGLWTSFVVTYGLPLTLYFLVVNLITGVRGVLSRSPEMLFSGCVIGVMLVFFVANRILDYWPAALIYILPFSYLTNRGVRPAARIESGAKEQSK
jgi:hypothetical protein